MNVQEINKNKKIVQAYKELIQECKQDIKDLNKNDSYNENLKEQTLSVLSNITLKMEMIMEIK